MPEALARVIEIAKKAARAEGRGELGVRHFLAASLADAQTRAFMREQWNGGRDLVVPKEWKGLVEKAEALPAAPEKMPLGPGFKETFQRLYRLHGGMPPLIALLHETLELPDPQAAELKSLNPGLSPEDRALSPEPPRSRLGKLVEEIAAVHNKLSRKIIGQGAAIQQIADALFAARMYDRGGDDAPGAVLLFLGPPGVGKTYTAQLVAESVLGTRADAFLRLDMAGYGDPNAFRMLVGFEPSFQGARPGILTEHVAAHPRSVILVDEIEKAYPNVHNLFLQVLDRGVLEDKFHKKNVSFDRTMIVFTTNLGKDLYAGPARSGFLSSSHVSRASVLEALRGAAETGPDQSALSPEFCSRLAKGYPIMFNHLSPVHLEEIARLAIEELDVEFNRQLGIRIPMPRKRLLSMLVLRLGPDLDARTVSSGIPLLIKDAFRDVLTEQRRNLVRDPEVFERLRLLELRPPRGDENGYFESIYGGGRRVTVVTGRPLGGLGLDRFPGFEWSAATSGREALNVIRRDHADFCLLDLDLHQGEDLGEAAGAMRALRRLRAAKPDLPVYLFCDRETRAMPDAHFVERLVSSCGARGFLGGPLASWTPGESSPLQRVRGEVLRERWLRELFRKRKTISFDWESETSLEDKEVGLVLRPRDIHEVTVVASRDRAARLTFTGVPSERFGQVAGAGEAKRRLREVIGWMRNPEAIRALGVDLPAGILLEGPPGNGKTMIARAAAGEAGLPFFAANATDFSSKWVGESEKNVRELFDRAASYAPSIVFIDEIDAIGGDRSGDRDRVHEQILTQLLVSMDGFARRDRPVFFLAATNRPDLLDPALKRPGRFDYVITVGHLGLAGREELLRLKTAGMPLARDADLPALARASWGLSGAQVAQIIKEAAILAFREAPPGAGAGEIVVSGRHLREALANVRHGLKKDGPLPPPEELRVTAYHEAGHALVAELERPGSVHQATILPRGGALGYVESLPEGEDHALSARELRSRVRVALAGRAAESLALGKDNVTTGCAEDLALATRMVTLAVTRFGMSERIGPVSLAELERLAGGAKASVRAAEEIERILVDQARIVEETLSRRREALDRLAGALMERETVDGSEISALAAGPADGRERSDGDEP